MTDISLTTKDRLICRSALEGHGKGMRKLAKRLEAVGEVVMAAELTSQADYIATALMDRFADQGRLALKE